MTSFDKFIADVGSWYWWVTAVGVSLVINLASAYLKPWLDERSAKRSEEKRSKLTSEHEKWSEYIRWIASDQLLIVMQGISETRYRLQSILFFTMAIFLIAIASMIVGLDASIPGIHFAGKNAILAFGMLTSFAGMFFVGFSLAAHRSAVQAKRASDDAAELYIHLKLEAMRPPEA